MVIAFLFCFQSFGYNLITVFPFNGLTVFNQLFHEIYSFSCISSYGKKLKS